MLWHNRLKAPGFVGPGVGSFVENPGSLVRIPGSIVESAGSFAAACCRIRDNSGRMSHQTRHHESLCRGICNIPAGCVAKYATTRAGMLHRMHQPEQLRGTEDVGSRARPGFRSRGISIRDAAEVGDFPVAYPGAMAGSLTGRPARSARASSARPASPPPARGCASGTKRSGCGAPSRPTTRDA